MKRKRSEERESARLVLSLNANALWTLRLMDVANAHYCVTDENTVELDAKEHLTRFAQAAEKWLVPLLAGQALAAVAYRLTFITGRSICDEWKPLVTLRQSFMRNAPPLDVSDTLKDVIEQNVLFMEETEEYQRSGRLSRQLSARFQELLTVPVSEGLGDLPSLLAEEEFQPVLTLRPGARVTTWPALGKTLKRGPAGWHLNALAGELREDEDESFTFKLDVGGGVLSPSEDVDRMAIVAAFLPQGSRNLIVVSARTLSGWIAALASGDSLHVITDERSWLKTDARVAPMTLLTTYEFLSSPVFYSFYCLAQDTRRLAQLETVYAHFTAPEPEILEALTEKQRRQIATQLFRTDLDQFLRLLQRNAKIEEVFKVAEQLCHGKQNKQSAEFRQLFASRFVLWGEHWDRLLLDNPRSYVWWNEARANVSKLSLNKYGEVKLATSLGHGLKRANLHMMFLSCAGFHWLIASQPFETPEEGRPCMDLLNVKVNGVPWSVYGEHPPESCLLPTTSRELRRRVFSLASIMTVMELCGFRQDTPVAKPLIERIEVKMSEGERALLALAGPGAASLPLVPREPLAHEQKCATCCVCQLPTDSRTNCDHEICEPCLDSWQATTLTQPGEPQVTCPVCRQKIQSLRLDFQVHALEAIVGSKVAALISFLRSRDAGGHFLCVSANEALLDECTKQAALRFCKSAQRWDAALLPVPFPTVVFVSTRDLFALGANLSALDLCLIFLDAVTPDQQQRATVRCTAFGSPCRLSLAVFEG